MAGKILPYEGIWTRSEVELDQNNIYIFGDNTLDSFDGYVPSTTQAVIRGLPNAFGIITKHDRRLNKGSFLSDESLPSYIEYLDTIFSILDKKLKTENKNVFVPMKDGQILIGAGKAQLPIKAPKCYQELCKRFDILFSKYGG